MAQSEQNLTRKLSSREKRRLSVYNMIPVDALDPLCSTRELIENKATNLYRYGCSLQDMNLKIGNNSSMEKKNLIFHLQGFIIFISSLIFIYIKNHLFFIPQPRFSLFHVQPSKTYTRLEKYTHTHTLIHMYIK